MESEGGQMVFWGCWFKEGMVNEMIGWRSDSGFIIHINIHTTIATMFAQWKQHKTFPYCQVGFLHSTTSFGHLPPCLLGGWGGI